MSHFIPVARWFGFLFGYAVASAVSMAASDRIGGHYLTKPMLEYLFIGIVVMAILALFTVIFRVVDDRLKRRSNKDGLTTGTSEAGAVARAA